MAKFSLVPFEKGIDNNIQIEVEVNQNNESFFVGYRITKGCHLIDLGSTTPNKKRAMKLWEKSCFELFIKNQNSAYLEFNFSPNFEWNCFYFPFQGAPLKEYLEIAEPKKDILLSKDQFFLFAKIDKSSFPNNFLTGDKIHIGLSSVILDRERHVSYWALTHCDSRPNFHHFDSFICTF